MISVIIPSYNSEETIADCLRSLHHQSFRDDYEIILVDSSIDRTPQIVQANFPWVKLIHLNKKTDPGTARNIGIKESRGDLIAFIDSDCVATSDWLKSICAAHDSAYCAVGGVVKNGNKENDVVALAGYMAEFRDFLPTKPKQEVMHIPTCNISYKREVFKKYGSFKGQYYPQEDLVFNHTLHRNGEKILLDPSIQVSHHHRSALNKFLNHQQRIGTVTARVLKTIRLQGASVVRHPLLAIPVLPFLPLVKFVRTLYTFLRYQPQTLLGKPHALPIFAIGLVYWLSGFLRGIYQNSPF